MTAREEGSGEGVLREISVCVCTKCHSLKQNRQANPTLTRSSFRLLQKCALTRKISFLLPVMVKNCIPMQQIKMITDDTECNDRYVT